MDNRVVDVGNCDMDHDQIRTLIQREFSACVVRCHNGDEAILALRQAPADLVLVNRKLDLDQSDGIDVIRRITSEPALAATPCMLITNFDEYQDAAIAAGGVRGFGKKQLGNPETVHLLSRYLKRASSN